MWSSVRRFFVRPRRPCDCPCKEHDTSEMLAMLKKKCGFLQDVVYPSPEELEPHIIDNDNVYIIVIDASLFEELHLMKKGKYLILEGEHKENNFPVKEINNHYKRWFLIPDECNVSTIRCERYRDGLTAVYVKKYPDEILEQMLARGLYTYQERMDYIKKCKPNVDLSQVHYEVVFKLNESQTEIVDVTVKPEKKPVIIPIFVEGNYFTDPGKGPMCYQCGVIAYKVVFDEHWKFMEFLISERKTNVIFRYRLRRAPMANSPRRRINTLCSCFGK